MAGSGHPSWDKVFAVLGDGKPKTHRQIVRATGLGESAVWAVLNYYWKKGFILRMDKPIREYERFFKGRVGFKGAMRSYYLYLFNSGEAKSLVLDGHRFVAYSEKYLDKRGARGQSKSQMILKFLEKNGDSAWYSKEIVEALKEKGVKPCDIMTTVRRYERMGMLYVRGYRTHDSQTPFKDGYLITWVDQAKPQEDAIREAVRRTDRALAQNVSTSPIIERVHRGRAEIIASTQLKDLASFAYLQSKMGCTEEEAERALKRALQLYPDLKEVKVFNNYKYYYHESMAEADLRAGISLKESYIRKVKGVDARVGHNWEACVEWFIDKFTKGAEFQTQDHRSGDMDPRRITLHLIKNVGDRRRGAEVDRVWTVTPGVFAKPITYVLECKWGVIHKRDVDEFFEVLRWSKEFGADTEKGRTVKQGIIGVFAGGVFDPQEKIYLKDEAISLASYAGRLNVQLLKAADFNEKLHERGVATSITVQAVCRGARDEAEVKETLNKLWENSERAKEILSHLAQKNMALYDFEKMLKETGKT